MVESGASDPRERSARVRIDGGATGGRLAVVEVRGLAGDGPPRHLHHWEDEAVCVLAGEVAFDIGGERRVAAAGDVVLLARGVEHAWRVTSPAARLLVILTPAGIEAAYGDLTIGAEPLEALVARAARHGIEITGPPLGS